MKTSLSFLNIITILAVFLFISEALNAQELPREVQIGVAIPHANRLENLKGDLIGFHSFRINHQWSVISQWKNSNAYDVKIVDYH